MRQEFQELLNSMSAMTREEIILSLFSVFEDVSERLAASDELSSSVTEMARQYQEMKEENASLKAENKELLKQNRHLTEQLTLRKNDLFGRSSEKLPDLESIGDDPPEDPLQEEPAEEELPQNAPSPERKPREHHGKKPVGKRENDLSRLSRKTEYRFDVRDFDSRYGEGNWRVFSWRMERTIESAYTVKHLRVVYSPVLSVGKEKELVCPYSSEKLLKGSLVSPSFFAEMVYEKFVLAVPSYRQEKALLRDGVILSRQNMTGWINRFAHDYLVIAYDYLADLLCGRPHNQDDETTTQVIHDGRRPGSVSYMWAHTTSELDPGPPIIVFSYEPTRGTDHLRRFYRDYSGCITSDGYGAYSKFAKESGTVRNSGCYMHARRPFSDALKVMPACRTPEEEKLSPEQKVMMLIQEIYREEGPLKELSPEERLKKRSTIVKEKVDNYFNWLKTLDLKDPAYSSRFVKGVQYSLNREDSLRMFLDDPMIPIDNGLCERVIRQFAIGRNNWLFSYSTTGAEANAIIYSLIETAKQNNAHPYYYIKYLMEILPKLKVTADKTFLNSLVPWSDDYRSYEKADMQKAVDLLSDKEPAVRPKTPKKTKTGAA